MKKTFTLMAGTLLSLSALANVTVDEVVGNYEWTYQSELALDEGRRAVPIEITAGSTPNTVRIKGMYLDYTFIADIDSRAETLSLRSQTVDIDFSLGAIKVYNVEWDDLGNPVAYERPVVASIADGKIIFNPDDMIGIGYGDLGMYYLLGSDNMFAPGEDKYFSFNPEEWTSAGIGSIVDGWLSYHYLGVDDSSVSWDAEYLVNNKNPYLFCILNPFDDEIWEPYNQDKSAEGYIVFDISDPDFVKLRTYVYSGFTDAEYGKLYMYSTDSHLHYVDGKTYDQLLDEASFSISTLEDGVVTIPMPAFGTESRPVGHYGWGMAYSQLILPENYEGSVDTIGETTDSRTEYYDLQGRRISAPQKGIYIKRQGSSVEKVIR